MERHGEGAGPGARLGTAPLYAGGITFGHKRPKLHSSGLRSSSDLAWSRANAAPEPMAGADRALRGFLLRVIGQGPPPRRKAAVAIQGG